jgi:hypothetical protein
MSTAWCQCGHPDPKHARTPQCGKPKLSALALSSRKCELCGFEGWHHPRCPNDAKNLDALSTTAASAE